MSKFTPIEKQKSNDIPLRILVIGIFFALVNAYWVSTNDLLIGLVHNYMSLFSNAVFTLFLLVLLNSVLKKYLPRLAFRAADLLVIYVMTVMVTTFAGNRMNRFVGLLSHPYWFATPENDWRNLFWRYIPPWFTVKDEHALSALYHGDTTFFSRANFMPWLGPILYWSAFLIVLYVVLICINTLIRKQFTEHERLTYPVTWLPLEMAKDITFFLKNRLMWAGFGIAAAIGILNGLSVLFPSLPDIPVGWTSIHFREKPWSYMGGTRISFQPFVIGLSYFMPLDLAFSAWFFYFLKKFTQLTLGATMGWRNLYFPEQAQGAWSGLGILALWVGRRHLKRVFTQVFTRKRVIDDAKEPMSYRTAVFGIVAGIIFLLFFAYKAGLSLWIILVFFIIYVCSALGVNKIRAGLGVAVHELLWVDPGETMVSSMGTRTFGARNLTVLSFLFVLNRDQPGHPMPNQLEAFRIGEQANIHPRKLAWAIILTCAIGIPVTFVIFFNHLYQQGAENSTGTIFMPIGREGFTQRLQIWLTNPTGHDYAAAGFMGFGFAMTGILLVMKMRFLWWPFHPVGYVLGSSPAEMIYIWVPVLISWCLKFAILRYGGLRAYRSALPFFVGLILGDYTLGCFWSIVGAVFRIPVYNMGWHPVTS